MAAVGEPIPLRTVVRRAVGAVVAVTIAAGLLIALFVGAQSAHDRPPLQAEACATAMDLVRDDPDSALTPYRARLVTAVFVAADVEAADVDYNDSCGEIWFRANAVAANMTNWGKLVDSCARWTEGSGIMQLRKVFRTSGVTAENSAYLPGDCAVLWPLVSAARVTATQATTSTPSTAFSDTDVLAEACSLLRRQVRAGDAAAAASAADVVDALAADPGAACADVPALATDTAWSEFACDVAAQRLRDGKTDEAAALAEVAAPSCAEIGVASEALADAGTAPAPSKTLPAKLASAWEGFLTSFANPLAPLGIVVLGGWVLLTVLARIATELPGIRHIESTRHGRRALAWWGVALVATVPVLIPLVAMAISADVLDGAWGAVAVALLAACGLVGAILMACWIATLQRLDVTVGGAEKVLTREDVLVRLRALAGASRNIELGSSATFADLDAALVTQTTGWVAVLQTVLRYLVGIKPWVARVDVVDAKGAFVTMSRNARTLSTARVDLDAPNLAPLTRLPSDVGYADVLAVFVAAEILIGLRPAYAKDFAAGLDGATHAQSIALQHVALCWFLRELDTQDAVQLLRAAVAADTFNMLAVATLRHAMWRTSSDPVALVAYGEWLTEFRSEVEEAR